MADLSNSQACVCGCIAEGGCQFPCRIILTDSIGKWIHSLRCSHVSCNIGYKLEDLSYQLTKEWHSEPWKSIKSVCILAGTNNLLHLQPRQVMEEKFLQLVNLLLSKGVHVVALSPLLLCPQKNKEQVLKLWKDWVIELPWICESLGIEYIPIWKSFLPMHVSSKKKPDTAENLKDVPEPHPYCLDEGDYAADLVHLHPASGDRRLCEIVKDAMAKYCPHS